MSQINDSQAGGFDPLRDHRPGTLLQMRHARFGVRVVERMQDGRYKVVDGANDTLGDINCAGFWPKATREIPGWAFAWPAVVTTGQRTTTTPSVPPSGGRTTTTPDPHSPGGSGVIPSRAPVTGERTVATGTSSSLATSNFQLSLGGSGPRASAEAPIRPSGAGHPWDDPAIQPSSWGDHTSHPTGGTPNVVNHWQDRLPTPARTVGANAG